MAKKGHLKNAIHTRRKHKRISGRRGPPGAKGGRRTEVVKAGDEFRKEKAEAKKKGAFDDMDAEEFLQGGFEDDFEDEDGDVEGGSGSEDDDLDDIDDLEEAGDDDLDDDDDDDELDGDDDDEDGDGEEDGAVEGLSGEEEEEEEEGDEEAEEAAAAAAGDAVAADNKRLRGEISKHRAQLEALREKDPEFYKYLQEADAELLGFGDGEEDDEDDEEESDDEEDEDEEDEEAGAKKKAKKEAAKKAKKGAEPGSEEEEQEGGSEEGADDQPGTSGRIDVTSALVAKWCAAALGKAPEQEQGKKAKQQQKKNKGGAEAGNGGGAAAPGAPALGSFSYLVKAYRLACHYGDPSEDAEEGRLRITSSTVYNTIMLFMLREADGIFRRLLGLPPHGAAPSSSSSKKQADVAKNPRWRKVGPLVKSFWGNSIHLLSSVTDPALLAFTLRRLRASVGLLAPFARLRDRFLRACLGVFGGGEVAPRLQAFLALRAAAVELPAPALDNVLKGVYRTYVSNAKFVSSASAPHIAFMSTCIVELWGLDMAASYQHAFTAVRQLAALMRTALSSKSADSYKAVYCWQTVNCMELWAKVLGAHHDRPELKPLVYPVVQLLLGAARLVPTPRYFPLRLRLARALNRLAAQSGVFIPVGPLVVEALGWADLRRPPGGGGGKGGGKGAAALGADGCPDLSLQLKLGKALLRSSAVQEEVVTQLLEVLAEHLACWSCSIALPELAHVPLLALRRFAKACPVERFR
ncbi:hypothetical protein HYH02_002526 [Chlamydomonas schloesseri]|nr:hypothetical protein HYH02_002526 [Chlamydomonas schloesseri]|eukprot:KAG2453202.1 hypothetical protein HYH02_002526 [Chlamydomonas schloesseri]